MDLVKCRSIFYKNKRIDLLPYLVHFTESSPISVQCVNPGVPIVHSQPYSTDTPTTSTTASAVTNTFSYPSTTNHDDIRCDAKRKIKYGDINVQYGITGFYTDRYLPLFIYSCFQNKCITVSLLKIKM